MKAINAPATTAPSLAARAVWGAVAGIGLALLLLGVPAALAAASGWPPPLPSPEALEFPHLHEREYLAIALAWAGWLVWAWLACTVIAQLVHFLRWGMRPETLRDSASPARWLAGALIGTVATALPATGAFAAAPAAASTATGLDTGADQAEGQHPARPLVWTTDPATAPADAGHGEEAGAPATATASAGTTGDSGTVHTVQKGQDLWTIAGIYYQDPTQWPRIWEANQGTVFAGGEAFTDPDELQPGWQLHIPSPALSPGSEPDEDGFVTETVDPDETLSGYASQYLGDETRYDEIFEVNQDRVQADGRTLTDPDEIIDGWEILIPTGPDAASEPVPEPEPEAEAEDDPVPPEGDDGPATEPAPADDTTAPLPDDETPAPEGSAEPETAPSDHSEAGESGAGGVAGQVPAGVWIAGGACLAAATLLALAARLRRKDTGTPGAAGDRSTAAPLSGRLSDLERVIEAAQQQLVDAPAEPGPDPAMPAGAGEDGAPVALRDLAGAGIGLLGPGQRGVAGAAIIAAATAGAQVAVTASANLRLDLEAAHLPANVRLVDDLAAGLPVGAGAGALLICTDTDIDDVGVDAYLADPANGAVILGEWAPAQLRIAGDGTVETATGPNAPGVPLGVLHTADPDTTAALLLGLAQTDPVPRDGPGPAAEQPTAAPDSEPAPAQGASIGAGSGAAAGETQPPAPVEAAAADAGAVVPVPVVRLCLFGSPELYVGDRAVAFKKGRRAKALLAMLALADGPVSRQDLLGAVLPGFDDAQKARNNLNSIGSATRKDLQTATGVEDLEVYHFDARTDMYLLDRATVTTDMAEFDAAEQAAALAADPAEATRHLEAAVRVYTDDLAPSLDTPAVNDLRRQYRQAAARAYRKLAAHYTDGGESARAAHCTTRADALTAPGAPS